MVYYRGMAELVFIFRCYDVLVQYKVQGIISYVGCRVEMSRGRGEIGFEVELGCLIGH